MPPFDALNEVENALPAGSDNQARQSEGTAYASTWHLAAHCLKSMDLNREEREPQRAVKGALFFQAIKGKTAVEPAVKAWQNFRRLRSAWIRHLPNHLHLACLRDMQARLCMDGQEASGDSQ